MDSTSCDKSMQQLQDDYLSRPPLPSSQMKKKKKKRKESAKPTYVSVFQFWDEYEVICLYVRVCSCACVLECVHACKKDKWGQCKSVRECADLINNSVATVAGVSSWEGVHNGQKVKSVREQLDCSVLQV